MKAVLLIVKEEESDYVLATTLKQKIQIASRISVIVSYMERNTLKKDLQIFQNKGINHVLVIPVNFSSMEDYLPTKSKVKDLANAFLDLKLDFINDFFTNKKFLKRFVKNAILDKAEDVMFRISSTQEISAQAEGITFLIDHWCIVDFKSGIAQ